jgi:hypothetical protein
MTRAILNVVFWCAAAFLVAAAHARLDRISIAVSSIGAMAAVFVCAFGYTRLHARHAGIAHALGVGITWLVLAIVAEMAMSAHLGYDWYGLLGTPDHPLLRNVFLFVWVFAPACFARDARQSSICAPSSTTRFGGRRKKRAALSALRVIDAKRRSRQVAMPLRRDVTMSVSRPRK